MGMRTEAGRLLAEFNALEEGSAVATKTKTAHRVCQDCLNSARKHDSKLESKPLTRHDVETLEWKCNGRNCYNRAKYSVDADAFTAARKKNKVLEGKG